MEPTNQSLNERLDEQAKKIDAIYESVEKTRKYFQWMLWITIIAIVLPLLASAFVIPSFLHSYLDALNGNL